MVNPMTIPSDDRARAALRTTQEALKTALCVLSNVVLESPTAMALKDVQIAREHCEQGLAASKAALATPAEAGAKDDIETLYATVTLEAIGGTNAKYAQGRRDLALSILPIVARLRAAPGGEVLKAAHRVVELARLLPKETPAPGGAATAHPFMIEAGVIWEIAIAVRAYDAMLAVAPAPGAEG